MTDTFNRVYQSGHTTTYCNGDNHYGVDGGFTGAYVPSDKWPRTIDIELLKTAYPVRKNPYPCNCALFQ